MKHSDSAITAAVFLFERENGRILHPDESAEIAQHGFESIDPKIIANDLVKSVKDNPSLLDSRYRNSCYWALGKRFDQSLLPFFRDALREELRRDMASAYQIMVALDNLEEPIFSYSSASIREYKKNREDAENYLAKI